MVAYLCHDDCTINIVLDIIIIIIIIIIIQIILLKQHFSIGIGQHLPTAVGYQLYHKDSLSG